MFTKEVTVNVGLTARRAVAFIQEANSYQSQIRIIKDQEIAADAKSVLGIMSLGLHKGQKITVEARGRDEQEAVFALINIVSGEDLGDNRQRSKINRVKKDHKTLIG